MTKNPIICALDTPDVASAIKLINSIKDNVGAFKLGMEFFYGNGPKAIEEVAKTGTDIFLDLKLHDIPNTVAQGIKQIAKLNCFMTTLHTLAGYDAMKAAKDALSDAKNKPLIIGVTILTSHKDINELGINNSISDQVLRLTELAIKAGLDGVVCSPHEIEIIRKNFGENVKLVVPGIRSVTDKKDDQGRTLSAKEAIDKGADYLVIGRPITAAENPPLAAKTIWQSLQ